MCQRLKAVILPFGVSGSETPCPGSRTLQVGLFASYVRLFNHTSSGKLSCSR